MTNRQTICGADCPAFLLCGRLPVGVCEDNLLKIVEDMCGVQDALQETKRNADRCCPVIVMWSVGQRAIVECSFWCCKVLLFVDSRGQPFGCEEHFLCSCRDERRAPRGARRANGSSTVRAFAERRLAVAERLTRGVGYADH